MGGKTVTKMLPDELYERFRNHFEGHSRVRQLLAELDELGLADFESDPAYGRRRTRGPTAPAAVHKPRSASR